MNADEFYEEFKDALRYLGPGWCGKDLIKVRIKKNKLVMKYEGREISINLEKCSEEEKTKK